MTAPSRATRRGAHLAPGNLLPALLVAAAGAYVFRGALRYGFSQDDFAGLARALGLAPRLAGPWRLLSQQLFFDALHALAGLRPVAWHAASLAAHGAAAALVYAWLARWASRPAALAGAAFFACHAAAFTALYWTAAFGDLGALVGALVALLLAERGGVRARWLALPAFAASLLCKESTLLLPLVAWAAAARRRGAGAAARDPLVLALAAVAVAFAAWLALAGSGTAPAESSLAPYAVALGGNLGRNLVLYAGWMANALVPLAHGFTDGVDPSAYLPGAALLALLAAGFFLPAARARGARVACVWVLAFLAPVLPLRNHVYHYYAYAALPGVAWAAAIAFDLATAWAAARARWALAGALALLCLLNGAELVARIESAPLFGPESRADPTVDRALVAARAVASVRAAGLPAGSRLTFWSPSAALAHGDPGPVERYAQRNVRAALEDGLGVRVLCPNVRACAFAGEAPPAPAGDQPAGDANADYVALYHANGSAAIVTRAQLDTLLAGLPR